MQVAGSPVRSPASLAPVEATESAPDLGGTRRQRRRQPRRSTTEASPSYTTRRVTETTHGAGVSSGLNASGLLGGKRAESEARRARADA